MALIRCDFYSEVLELSTAMTVILPQATSTQIGLTGAARPGGHPTLYLLHGMSDDDTIWIRRTSIERYVAPLGLAVVMPQVHRSYYMDEAHGNRYWTFLSEELPALAAGFFNLSQRRADTFVAALREPERFAAAASLSGSLDVVDRQARGHRPQLMERILAGRSVAGTDDDVFALLGRAEPSTLPDLYLGCGAQDPLLTDSVRFVEAAGKAGVAVTVDFGPGDHDWSYWDDRIQHVLAWLPLNR
jgi:putative tributyrin esterase